MSKYSFTLEKNIDLLKYSFVVEKELTSIIVFRLITISILISNYIYTEFRHKINQKPSLIDEILLRTC